MEFPFRTSRGVCFFHLCEGSVRLLCGSGGWSSDRTASVLDLMGSGFPLRVPRPRHEKMFVDFEKEKKSSFFLFSPLDSE